MAEFKTKKVIFHIDVNSAFLSWSAVEHLLQGGRLDYRSVASAVAKDNQNGGGVILAKSIPAKKFGVSTGEVVWQAKQKCPELLLVPPNYHCYLRASHAMKELLRDYSPAVESFSIDECFLDMTGQEKFFGPPEQAAGRIKDRIREELGFTVNVGIAANKAAAKMASEFEKPDRVHTLWPSEIETKLWPEPIDFLFMAGRRTVKKLRDIGVTSIGAMARLDPLLVKEMMGKNGVMLWHYANGRDDSPVLEGAPPPPKSVSKSVTLHHVLRTKRECEDVLFYIAEELSYKLREKGMTAAVIAVALKDRERCYFSRQQRYADPILHYNDICEKMLPLLDEIYPRNGVKYLCLSLSELSSNRPLSGLLFGRDIFKEERLAEAVFGLKKRYGKECLTTARTLSSGAKTLFRHFDEDEYQDDVMPRFY